MTTTTDRIIADPVAIAAALAIILPPGQVTELRVLDAVTAGNYRPHVESGYFDNPASLAEAAATIRAAKGFYFTPNPVNPALLARSANRIRPVGKEPTTSDNDVTVRHWLLIDADAVRPSGISASDAEHAEALDRCRAVYKHLRAAGWPDPIAADSGNGAHLLYRVDLPAADDGLIERCLLALADQFDDAAVTIDRKVFNPARIWKLYGTLSAKGDDTPERPHRMARVLSHPSKLSVVDPMLLRILAGPKPVVTLSREGGLTRLNIDRWIVEHGLHVRGPEDWKDGRKWIFDVCPWDVSHTNGSAFLIQQASGALVAGCHHNGCDGKGWHDLRDLFEPNWRNGRNGNRQKPCAPVEEDVPFDTPFPEPMDSASLSDLIEQTISGKRRNISFPWQTLSFAARALLPGSVTVICGGAGSTKSMLVSEACIFWMEKNVKFAVFHLEEDRAFHLNRALAQLAGNSGLTLDDYVHGHPEKARDAYEQYMGTLDALGSRIWDAPNHDVSIDDLCVWIDERAKEGCRVIVVDPVTAADSGSEPWRA
ncbi:MAG: hypothetical protein Q8R92_18510, partial [Deltaproteobacteria bacterium]|nr:hypothetical protein [Deltaproteobacteria bacterium]